MRELRLDYCPGVGPVLATARLAVSLTERPFAHAATSRPGLDWRRRQHSSRGKEGSAVSASKVTAICAACSWRARSLSSVTPKSMHQTSALAHGIVGAATDEGRSHRAGQKIARMVWAMMARGERTSNLSRRGVNEIASDPARCECWEGEQHERRAGLSGDQENPFLPSHRRMPVLTGT